MSWSLLPSQLESAQPHHYGSALLAAAGRIDTAERMRQRAEACRERARAHVTALDVERSADGSTRRHPIPPTSETQPGSRRTRHWSLRHDRRASSAAAASSPAARRSDSASAPGRRPPPSRPASTRSRNGSPRPPPGGIHERVGERRRRFEHLATGLVLRHRGAVVAPGCGLGRAPGQTVHARAAGPPADPGSACERREAPEDQTPECGKRGRAGNDCHGVEQQIGDQQQRTDHRQRHAGQVGQREAVRDGHQVLLVAKAKQDLPDGCSSSRRVSRR
jgi:hypothetical protein